MKNVLKIGLVAIAMVALSFTAQAQQKFAYVDAQAILADLPAVKQAEANLEALQLQLQKKLQASVEQLQKDYMAVQQKVERGELSPVQQEQEGQKLQQRQQELAAEEQGMVEQIQNKRNELLEPIYNSLNDAIKAVASENGYTFIFDKQVLLFGEESQDVSEAVKSKMGL
ncbi:MAG: OmpH family outer membrane protein [Saprospiraceae bacterium]